MVSRKKLEELAQMAADANLSIREDDLDGASVWQLERFEAFLRVGHRTMPRFLNLVVEDLDLRVPWRQDMQQDVHDVFQFMRREFPRGLKAKLARCDVGRADRWVCDFWDAIRAGNTPPVVPDFEAQAVVEDVEEQTDFELPEDITSLRDIAERYQRLIDDVAALGDETRKFLSALSSLSFRPDRTLLKHEIRNARLLLKLTSAGIHRVCELQYAVSSGFILKLRLRPIDLAWCTAFVSQRSSDTFTRLAQAIENTKPIPTQS